MMARRFWLAGLALLLASSSALAVITAPVSLEAFLSNADYIFVAKIETVEPSKPAMILHVSEDLKDKARYRRLPVVFRPDDDAKKLDHLPQLLKRVAPGGSMVFFVSQRGKNKKFQSNAFINGTWMQILGEEVEPGRAVLVVTHGEPYLKKMFSGTSDELAKLIKDHAAGKAKLPPLNEKQEAGFGPEAPMKQSRGADPEVLEARPAVIPTLGVGGPLVILALLFPTVFGGVLVLFRQWTAFITMLSINSTTYLLIWWRGQAWFGNSWWTSEIGLWFLMTLVVLICTMWAWRRQLQNLALGVDALDTPARTELLVLALMSTSCVGFVAFTMAFAPPPPTDLVWNLTLVLTGGVVLGLIYKLFRTIFDVMIPMATEGIMLGATLLGHLLIFAFLTHLSTGTVQGRIETPAESLSSESPRAVFVGDKPRWTFQTAKGGLFISAPLIAGDKLFAASAHTTFKFGTLYCFDLDKGTEQWTFEDDGDLKQVYSSPTLADGKLFIGEGFHEDPRCKIYCIDAATGAKVWSHQTTSQTESNPVAVGGKVFIGCGNDGFCCFAADSKNPAEPQWRFPPKGATGRLLRFGAGAFVVDGKVYVGTGVDRLQKDDKGETAFFCLDAATGTQVWKLPMPHPVWAAPVVHQGKLFVAVGNGDVFNDADNPAGVVYCLDPVKGEILWQKDLPNSVLQTPAVDERHVYVGSRDGNCYALDRDTGSMKWHAPLGSPVIASPRIATSPKSGRTTSVFAVGSKGKVTCLDPSTGAPHWSYNLEDQRLYFGATPAVAVRLADGGEQRFIVLGAGDPSSGAKATLICLEDRWPAPK